MILFFLLSLSSIFANIIDISSTILDNNLNPIENVTVNCIDNYSLSDVDGYFSIKCNEQNIIYQSFWTLTANSHILESEELLMLSDKYNKTVPQILYR